MPLTVYVVRHGERIDHVDPHWAASRISPAASFDPPLSKHGVQQASKTGEAIAKDAGRVLYVLSSPFLRCLQTADEIRRRCGRWSIEGVPLHVHSALSEWMTPAYFPHPPSPLPNRDARFQCSPLSDSFPSHSMPIPNVHQLPCYPEAECTMQKRFASFMTELEGVASLNSLEHATIVVVTHGAGVAAIMEFAGNAVQGQRIGYCAMSKLGWDGRWRVNGQCSNEHLREGLNFGLLDDRRMTWDDDLDLNDDLPDGSSRPVAIARPTSARQTPSSLDHVPDLMSSPPSPTISMSPSPSPASLHAHSCAPLSARTHTFAKLNAGPTIQIASSRTNFGSSLDAQRPLAATDSTPAKSWAYAKAFESAFRSGDANVRGFKYR